MNLEATNNLERFIKAQESVYPRALSELKAGLKQSHWMWFIFPQVKGLGRSQTAQFYAIQSTEEAQDYLNHDVLGPRLIECTEAVLKVHGRTVSQIFGYPDDMKFKSSMTLFAFLSEPGSLFEQAIVSYFNGQRDNKTIDILQNV